MYEDFISDFSKAGNYFKFPRLVMNAQGELEKKTSNPYYNWEDQVYREFMIGVLRLLEPRSEDNGTMIYLTIQEVEEMFFIMNGTIDIGFEESRTTKYVLRLPKRNVIGAFNCTFNKKTLFMYKVSKKIEAYTIRKQKWLEHINNDEFKDIVQTLKSNVRENYFKCIKDRIILQQKLYMSKKKQKAKKGEQHLYLTLVNIWDEKTALYHAANEIK